WVDVRDVASLQEDPARGRLDQPVDHLYCRRLAAARRTHQGDELSARHIERQLAHRDGPVRVHLRYAVQADHRLSGTVIVMLLPAAHSTSVTDDCLTRNDSVCLEYLTSRRSQLLDALG